MERDCNWCGEVVGHDEGFIIITEPDARMLNSLSSCGQIANVKIFTFICPSCNLLDLKNQVAFAGDN
jgi:hypothetical protein